MTLVLKVASQNRRRREGSLELVSEGWVFSQSSKSKRIMTVLTPF
jgi:hypothetical protein